MTSASDRAENIRKAVAAKDDRLLTPALVVDLDAVDHNIDSIIARTGGPKRWRPHVKTHKQAKMIGMLMRKRVTQFKCSTVDELALVLDTAERFHPEGHVDAMLAYPATRNVCRAIVDLIENYEGGRVRMLADSPDHMRAMDDWFHQARLGKPLDVVLDVDVGMHRTGSAAQTWADATDVLGQVSKLTPVGLHGYEGHLGWDDAEAANQGYDELVALAGKMPPSTTKLIVTSGSHSFVHAVEHKGLGEGKWTHQVSPGTLVLSDLRSQPAHDALGLQHGVFVVSRVISRPGDDRITLDAGSKAISPDRPAPACQVLGREGLSPLTASEEHTPVEVTSGQRPALGEVMVLVPDHACTTVNLHRTVLYVRGDELVGSGPVDVMSRTTWVRDRRP